jgi:hypothetical protein
MVWHKGTGPLSTFAITALVQSWYVTEGDAFQLDAKGRRVPLVTGKTSDFAPVTHGQLKEVARHFFDRLQAELYNPTGQPYPWDAPIRTKGQVFCRAALLPAISDAWELGKMDLDRNPSIPPLSPNLARSFSR